MTISILETITLGAGLKFQLLRIAATVVVGIYLVFIHNITLQ